MITVGLIGATSPLGIHLVDILVDKGYKVLTGYRSRVHIPEQWNKSESILLAKTELDEYESLKTITESCNVVVWLAHLQQNRLTPKEIPLNIHPLKRLLDELPDTDISKLVFISSGGSVYGEPVTLPISENHPRNPLSSYGEAKKEMEDLVLKTGPQLDISTAIIRPGNLYGPESLQGRSKGIVGACFQSILHSRPFTLIGDGSAIRDYVHITDVARAIIYAIESKQKRIVWNVGTGIGHSVTQVSEMISRAFGGVKPETIVTPAYSTDASKNILSIDTIGKEAGWTPEIKLDEGIAELAVLCKKNAERLKLNTE
jgi:UDP-glucose 4-epimerase